MTEMKGNYQKVFVAVLAEFSADGILKPLSLRWEDGENYTIDRIVDIRPAASLKVGGQGVRYTVHILGKEVCMYLEDGRWFLEKRN